ncbi:MAG TPA: hypothetical protein VGW38_28380, partial [Chloroflexota bacterium]|nr:hypothetical protein [Chloroflexota bacterium]
SFGSASGVELCEPLTFKGRMGSGVPGGRNGYADESLTPEGGQSADWKKYRYTYRVWGRCTYSPETDPDGWRRYLRHEFGQDASHAEEALASASRILLLITTAYGPSANCKMYWPEVYTNMPLVSEVGHPYTDTFSPKRFGNASSLDPELFASVDEFAEEVLTGNRSGRYSPLDVARWLDSFATTATNSLSRWPSTLPPSALRGEGQGEKTLPIQEQGEKGISPEARRWQADIAIQASLGQFFADKLRAGLAYAFYCRTGDQASLREALDSYRSARGAWAAAAAHGRVYRDDLTFGPEPWQRGHWADRLPAIDADIAAMEAHLAQGRRQVNGETTASSAGQRSSRDLLSFTRDGAPCPAEVLVEHTPPASFARGEPVSIEVAVAPVNASLVPAPVSVQLRYRHANQAEAYEMVEMQAETAPEANQDDGAKPIRYRATIPVTYTDSPYPLVYFFHIRDASDRAWLHPGLDETLSNQPYYLLRQVPH